MIQPVEMRKPLPMMLHGGVRSTTNEVWEMLLASRNGNLDRVMQLISDRPELSTCQYNYTPPLHFAVREGHLPVVRALVEQKAFDPEYKTYPFGDSLLTMAQDRNHDEVSRFLQGVLEDPERTRKWGETGKIHYEQDAGQIHFDKMVHEGNLKEVERLLGERPELARNELSSWAEGVLMMPARRGDRPMLECLIRFGAQVPTVSKWGRFYYFVHDNIAAFLLESGMNPKHMTWHQVTLLHDMAQSGEIAKAGLLLDHGADINAVDEEYRSTPLGLAARWGQREMAAFLLKKGADPNKAGARWSMPLTWAQKKGHHDLASDLMAAGARAS
jgi:choline dehydrogenase-like flavoprotein